MWWVAAAEATAVAAASPPVNVILSTSGWLHRVAPGLGAAGHHVEDARWETGVFAEPSEHQP